MSAVDELDDALASEPTICKYVLEAGTFADGTLYHADGQGNLVCVILPDTLADCFIAVALWRISCVKFFLGHTIVAFLALLADKGKVEKHLADAVRKSSRRKMT